MNGGIDLVATSLDDFKEMRIRYGQLVGMPFLAECYSQAGDIETSLSTANDALQLLLEKPIKRDAAMTLELLGRIYSHSDRNKPAKAQECFHDALQASDEEDLRGH